MRHPIVAGNWKMNGTVMESTVLAGEIVAALGSEPFPQVIVCPQYLALSVVAEAIRTTPIDVYAQNMHEDASGAFTGEVSGEMLVEAGIDGVILGHSERRQYFGESDKALGRKLPKALELGLIPILCVGETESERAAGGTESRLRTQIQEALRDVPINSLDRLVVAYEPVWAIGTGVAAEPEQVQAAHSFIRALIAGFDEGAAKQIRILYGGSVKPSNAGSLMTLPDVDGALVGGASLNAGDFAAIVTAATDAVVTAQ